MAIDGYERITARILQQLENGTVPWRKPWRGGEAGHPRNLVSGRPYRGINTCAPYDVPFWLTFRQAKQIGGHVRKGEESTPVIFWRWVERENPETGNVEKFPVLRHYNAFNLEQCDLPAEKVPETARWAGKFRRVNGQAFSDFVRESTHRSLYCARWLPKSPRNLLRVWDASEAEYRMQRACAGRHGQRNAGFMSIAPEWSSRLVCMRWSKTAHPFVETRIRWMGGKWPPNAKTGR